MSCRQTLQDIIIETRKCGRQSCLSGIFINLECFVICCMERDALMLVKFRTNVVYITAFNLNETIGRNRSQAQSHSCGAITFAHIFQKFRLRTCFICAQKCILFVHSFSVTFAHMFLHLFLGQLLVFYYIKVHVR